MTELTGVRQGRACSERRLTRRNGYRERRWDTRVARSSWPSRVRDGSYFPSLLEPRRRAERALLAVVRRPTCPGCDAPGGDLVEALGIASIGRAR